MLFVYAFCEIWSMQSGRLEIGHTEHAKRLMMLCFFIFILFLSQHVNFLFFHLCWWIINGSNSVRSSGVYVFKNEVEGCRYNSTKVQGHKWNCKPVPVGQLSKRAITKPHNLYFVIPKLIYNYSYVSKVL